MIFAHQCQPYSSGLEKWVEIGNSGMFRPEMLEPMGLPKDVTAIAWGLSLERCVLVLLRNTIRASQIFPPVHPRFSQYNCILYLIVGISSFNTPFRNETVACFVIMTVWLTAAQTDHD